MGVDEASRLSRFLNEQLNGIAVDQVNATLQAKLEQYLNEERRMATQALQVLELLPPERGSQLFLEGATQLFEQPEFRDVDKAREVFGLLEERERMIGLLRAGAGVSGSPRVIIGRESAAQGMDELSLVTAAYRIGGEPVGTIGVLGPRRMPYWRLTGVVEYTANVVGRLLTRLAG
jgi:heat-inducible transcriptional repressor